MKINKNQILMEELVLENDMLRNNISRFKDNITVLKDNITVLNRKVLLQEEDINNKERVIQDILNSKTFRIADKIGKFFRGKRK